MPVNRALIDMLTCRLLDRGFEMRLADVVKNAVFGMKKRGFGAKKRGFVLLMPRSGAS